ncbi:MAG: CAAX amino terminal protease self- immunity [Methanocella sp. PtaU1.Bin125]|nr:MAG: CAAX amino terminal protease self- immunity [Methanocella sp. PtaU1.Bin125]
MASPITKNRKFMVGLKLAALFVIILIAAFTANAAVIIGINVYYHATIHDTQQAAAAISAALDNIWVTFFTLLLQNAAFVFVAWLFLMKVDKVKFSWKEFGLDVRRDTPKLTLSGIGLNLFLSVPLFGILLLIGAVSFEAFGTASFSLTSIILSFVLMAIGTLTIGFGEEILFRGYVQNMLTKKYGILWALPLASVFFVAVHVLPKFMTGSVELLYFLSIFPVALILGYLFYVTKSLWASVAFHALEDFVVLALVAFGKPTAGTAPLIILSAPIDITIEGVKLGNWGDAIGLAIGAALFMAMVAYFWNKQRAGQIDGRMINKKSFIKP